MITAMSTTSNSTRKMAVLSLEIEGGVVDVVARAETWTLEYVVLSDGILSPRRI